MAFPRSSQRYVATRDPQDTLRVRLRDLAGVRVRYGYRRLHVLLRREGWEVNHKRVYRLYTQERLTIFNGVTLDFSELGKPTDNAYIASFNGRFREECLNLHWFVCVEDARSKTGWWRRDYNEDRPHSALGNLAPGEFAKLNAGVEGPKSASKLA